MALRFLRSFCIGLILTTVIAIRPEPVTAQSALDITLHYVEATPSADKAAYDVAAYLSVFDSNENPIKDLALENFALIEDSNRYSIDSVRLTTDEPANIVLLIDISSSMHDQKIKDALEAAAIFVQNLGEQDRIAVVTFEEEIKTWIDFTSDHAAAQDQIKLIKVIPNSGTCLYDALYQATQMTTAIQTGRRSVMVLTDGVDETIHEKVCSKHNIDDVINLAAAGTLRVPLYTISIGNLVDEKGLTRIAVNTGGRYLHSRDSGELIALFQRLTDQLRSQYVLQYRSTGSSGEHVLTAQVNYQQALGRDTRKFLLPNLPLRLNFVSPLVGATLDGKVKLLVATTGQGAAIANVTFSAGEAVIGSDDTAPYELEVDSSAFKPGGLILRAAALDSAGNILTEASVTVNIPAPPTVTPTSTPTLIPVGTPPPQTENNSSILLIVTISFALLFVALIALLVMRRRQDKQEETWRHSPAPYVSGNVPEMTMDQVDADDDALAVLTVVQSDELSTGARKYNVIKSVTRLGRSRENDLAFPGESPVSRFHATIEQREGELFIKEILSQDEEGNPKPPRFGTFVNESKVGESGMRIKSGDKLRLGKRLTLQVSIPKKSSAAFTSDAIDINDPDKTNDSGFDPDKTNDAEIK